MTNPGDRQVPDRVRVHVCITVNRSHKTSDSDESNWLLLFLWRGTSEKKKRTVVTFPVFPEGRNVVRKSLVSCPGEGALVQDKEPLLPVTPGIRL